MRVAIDALYRAFQNYPQPRSSHVSPISGITPEQIQRLYSKPLRELSASDLERYARAALTTWGDARELKHYLPRMFELLAVEPGWTDASLLLERLHAAEWETWPEDERTAVLVYVEELWKFLVGMDPDIVDASEVLCGCGLAGIDPTKLIEIWRRDVSLSATKQLARLINYEKETVPEGLDRRWLEPARSPVLELLREEATQSRLEAAYLEHPEHRELASAVDILSRPR